MRRFILAALVCIALISNVFSKEPANNDAVWPQWRGPFGTGVAPDANPPIHWSEEKNVDWKKRIPGQGHAAPVIWGDRLFVLTAIQTDETGDPEKTSDADEKTPEWMRRRGRRMQPTNVVGFTVIALDRNSGDVMWQKTARKEQPHEGTHFDATWASNSPVTDGHHLFAHFGSRGLYCYDLNGALQWEVDLGDMTTRNGFGEGSSPALYDDILVVNWDHEGDSFITALNKNTGEELWRRERDEVTSWSTPIVVEVSGTPQVIINATTATRAYDLRTGEIVWQIGGMTVNTVPSPVYDNGMVYVMSGYRGSMLQAIQLAKARGNLQNTGAVAWTLERDTPYVPSPLLYEGFLYFLKVNKGILSCFDAATGKPLYGPERIEEIQNIYASPVGGGGRVYITGREGTTVVLKNGPKLSVLGQNKLNDMFDASAAIAGNRLYLRGHEFLYSIAEK